MCVLLLGEGYSRNKGAGKELVVPWILCKTLSGSHRAGIQSYCSIVFLYPIVKAQNMYSCIICTKMCTSRLLKMVSTAKAILEGYFGIVSQ